MFQKIAGYIDVFQTIFMLFNILNPKLSKSPKINQDVELYLFQMVGVVMSSH